MIRLGRKGQLELLPNWISEKIEINRYETYRLLEAQFTTEKLQQLTSLLEEFIALGVPAGRGEEEE